MLDVLTRIQDYAADYVTDKVTLNISDVDPDDGFIISPEEDFEFTIRATNANAENGGVRLINVIWHVWLEHPDVSPNSRIFVPDLEDLHTRSTLNVNQEPMNRDGWGHDLYIFPQGGRGVLDVGETNKLDLTARGTSATDGVRNAKIKFEIFADLDLALSQSQSASPQVKRFDVLT